MSSKHLIDHKFQICREKKESLLKQKGRTIWLMGLSGSGKSTIANSLETQLHEKGLITTILDGDTVRKGLCNNLGFSSEDRKENLRRVAETAKLFSETGIITICCFITPEHESREIIKAILGDDLTLIFLSTNLETCELRDPKGLYKKARKSEIKNFTGISSPFEAPDNPDLVIDTSSKNKDQCVREIITFLGL